MTPEHTDRDLRERARALLDAWDAHGYMRPSSLAAAFGELRAALTASEGPRCSCGQDAATEAEFLEPRHPDPNCPFHGIEASEGERITFWVCPECGFTANDADAWSDRLTSHCPHCGNEELDPEPATFQRLPDPQHPNQEGDNA